MPPALAFAVAALLAWGANRVGSLSRSGALGALLVGGAALTAGVAWGAFLLLWFAAASAASHMGRVRKAARSRGIIAKGDQRDVRQVLANGGVFALSALATRWGEPSPDMATSAAIMGAAALAAAGADTLATECGILWGGQPWSLRGRRVPPGTSGAVSMVGMVALGGGAMLFAMLAFAVGLISRSIVPMVALAAMGGALADTILGATWQARRWCATCASETEQTVHVCGTPTVPHGGLPWLDNDVVNAACTMTAALVIVAVLATGHIP